jgi:hypothetical protein
VKLADDFRYCPEIASGALGSLAREVLHRRHLLLVGEGIRPRYPPLKFRRVESYGLTPVR